MNMKNQNWFEANSSRDAKEHARVLLNVGFWIVCCAFLLHSLAQAQGRQEPGRSIGTVSTQGNLIVMELDEGVLGKANLFDLAGRTLRFIPDKQGYRVENVALQWDAEFGAALTGSQVALHNFKFPYSGKTWDAFSIGTTGSISFSAAESNGRNGGVSIGRFDQLAQAARTLVNTVPAICVFLKPRMSGPRYIKESADRVVITWELTEPIGGIQDFTWVKTVNRFQAVLHRDGMIEMSYDQIAAKDAIVGLYPVVTTGTERVLATLTGEKSPAIAPHLNLQSIKVAVVDNLFLKITLETRGPLLPEGDPGLAGIAYRVYFDTHKPLAARPK